MIVFEHDFFKVMSILSVCATGVTLWNKGLSYPR